MKAVFTSSENRQQTMATSLCVLNREPLKNSRPTCEPIQLRDTSLSKQAPQDIRKRYSRKKTAVADGRP